MHILPFSPSDISEVSRLFRETVVSVNEADYNPDQISAWASAVDDEGSFRERLTSSETFIARIDDKIVGFINLLGNGRLDCLYVHKDHQRQGIASALLQKIEVIAKKALFNTIRTDACITARKFFEHSGYELVEEQRVEFKGVAFENYVMEKKLKTEEG